MVVVGVVGLLAMVLWLRSDERRIRGRLEELAEQMEKDGPEDQLAAFAVARGVSEAFAPGFVVLATPYQGRIADIQELMSAVMTFRNASPRIEVDIRDVALEVNKERRTAAMGIEATVTMETGPDERARESYRIRMAWLEDNGTWLIHQLEVVEILEGGTRLF